MDLRPLEIRRRMVQTILLIEYRGDWRCQDGAKNTAFYRQLRPVTVKYNARAEIVRNLQFIAQVQRQLLVALMGNNPLIMRVANAHPETVSLREIGRAHV